MDLGFIQRSVSFSDGCVLFFDDVSGEMIQFI